VRAPFYVIVAMTIRVIITAALECGDRPISALELLLRLYWDHTDGEVRCALAALTRDGTIRKVKRWSTGCDKARALEALRAPDQERGRRASSLGCAFVSRAQSGRAAERAGPRDAANG
jgi:hypothetical protein